MTTISVPVSPIQEAFINAQVKKGFAANKAEVVRKALTLLAEEEAVAAVLKAEQEPTLKGNIKDLMKKI